MNVINSVIIVSQWKNTRKLLYINYVIVISLTAGQYFSLRVVLCNPYLFNHNGNTYYMWAFGF